MAGGLRERAEGQFTLLRLAPAAGWRLVAALVGVLAIEATAPAFLGVAIGMVVGAIPEVVASGVESDAGGRLNRWLLVLAAVLVLHRVSGPVRIAVTNRFGRAIDLHLRDRVMRAALRPPGIMHLEDPGALDLIELSRGISAWGGSPGLAVAGLSTILTVRLAGVVSLVILAAFRWWLPLGLGAVAWVVVRTKYDLYLKMSTQVTGRAEELRRSRYFRDLLLSPEAAKEIRVFGLGSWAVRRFNAAWLAAMTDAWQARRGGAWRVFAVMILRWAAAIGSVVLVAKAAVDGDISLAAAVVFAQAVDNSAVLSYTLGSPELFVHQGRTGHAATLALEARVRGEDRLGDRPAEDLPTEAIRFEEVRFRYPGREVDVFGGLDLEIRAGESLAIVGENGAGKTTIVKLLAGLYLPTAGRITVDGIDLRDLDPLSWHRRVAAIFQDFVRFPVSMEDNVAWGAVHRPPDAETLEAVADEAGITDVIESLSEGWQTVLSRQYVGGADLSGGQWQRVALARALYATRGGARVLVLDEPTAHLDVRAEAALYNRFLDLTRDRTAVIISHRFSTVRRADRIVVIEHGEVVEDGSHDELVVAGGRYGRMFAAQAARFVEVSDDADN